MAIKRIKVSNFKSFDELEVELCPLNIVIGANAAGKSNFLEVFRFLRDVAEHGLGNAISIQGGMEYLTNLRLGRSRPVSLDVVFDSPQTLVVGSPRPAVLWMAKIQESLYRLSFDVQLESPGFRVIDDRIVHQCEFFEESDKRSIPQGRGTIDISHHGSQVEPVFSLDNMETILLEDSFLSLVVGKRALESDSVLLEKGVYLLSHVAEEISTFDLDSKLSKKATPVTGRADLDPDGSNLAIVLRNILQDDASRQQLTILLRDLLPFVEDLKVDRFADKSLLISLKERFSQGSYLPAAFLSDGTIHLTALILALYFDKAPVVIIEEPERNIHPHLISKVAAMLADASQKKQVIVTTHNPELVKHARPEDLLLIQRDANGFSRISRPAESEELKVFLENDLGVDELYVQNLLGSGNGV